MIKFHVNDKGEAGKCRARGEGCPFGGDSKHYGTLELAREAFEKANAGKQLPETAKKMTRRERKELAARRKALEAKFDSRKFGDLQFSDIVFNRARHEELNRVKVKKAYPKLSKSELEDIVQRRTESDRRSWERRARTTPPESFEKNVPIRLVPIGTNLVKDDGEGGVMVVGKIEPPTIQLDIAQVVGCYRDNNGNLQKVNANTAVSIGQLPQDSGRTPSPWAWVREDAKAIKLQRYREKFAELYKL